MFIIIFYIEKIELIRKKNDTQYISDFENMVTIRTRLQNNLINLDDLIKKAEQALQILGYQDFDLGIMLTTNSTIKKYNRIYRNKDKATDVLSFPYHQIIAGDKITIASEDDKNLGDMIISVEYVAKAAEKLGTTFEKRMHRMLIHSLCHLLGYDHIKDDEFSLMIAKEKELAQAMKLECSWE